MSGNSLPLNLFKPIEEYLISIFLLLQNSCVLTKYCKIPIRLLATNVGQDYKRNPISLGVNLCFSTYIGLKLRL